MKKGSGQKPWGPEAGAFKTLIGGADVASTSNTTGLVGPGTENRLAMFTASAAVGDSQIADAVAGSVATFGGTLTADRTYYVPNASGTLALTSDLLPPAAHDMVTSHTYTGGTALDVFGLSAASTIARLTPSANPGVADSILKSNEAGGLQLTSLGIGAAPISSFVLYTTGDTGLSDLYQYTDGATLHAIYAWNNSAGSNPFISLYRGRGTQAVPLNVAANDEVGAIDFWALYGGSHQKAASILSLVNAIDGGTVRGDLIFYAGAQEALRLRDTGGVPYMSTFGVAPVARSTGWAVTAGYTPDKVFNPLATTETEIATVLGTLIDYLITLGLLGA